MTSSAAPCNWEADQRHRLSGRPHQDKQLTGVEHCVTGIFSVCPSSRAEWGVVLPVQEALRGGIPQSASMTSFAAVYGALSDDEASGLTPPQSMGYAAGEGNPNGLAPGPSAQPNGRAWS